MIAVFQLVEIVLTMTRAGPRLRDKEEKMQTIYRLTVAGTQLAIKHPKRRADLRWREHERSPERSPIALRESR
jgi:hypothetical protein